MKIYKFVLFLLIFTMIILLYPSNLVALYKEKWNIISSSKTKNHLFIPHLNILNKDAIQRENNIIIHHLNQKYLGTSDYEKAQRELQKFNRPLIGIVGQYSDWVSYKEYQKKILGSAY